MTTLKQTVLPVWAAELHGESSLPLLQDARKLGEPKDTDLPEGDGLFIDYGAICSAFPYRAQDCYSRELTVNGLDAVVLENEHLIASFVPEQGGKLWSLYDKDAGKELLFANHVFRPAYLALRNAWASGGVEWNCGALVGHHPHTAAPVFTAVIDAENSGLGCPVLRFYTFERIRSVTQQMDFYLPEGSKFLHCRMRVVNDTYETQAMYWWSNIAVPSDPQARCVVPADHAYTPVNGKITCVDIPVRNGRDVTYPTQNPIAVDYFFRTYENHRHYTSHLDKNGYGLVETSTSRLKGRKLFVWGQGQGGDKWQEYLCGDDGHGTYGDGKYCEIQCGLANSQYECLPMPPKTAWEWIEYYGPMQADPVKIHGAWADAQTELEARLDAAAPMDAMEQELKATHKMATSAADRMLLQGYGWGALENVRRAKLGMPPICPHLDFGTCTPEQAMWENLIRTGSLRTADNADAKQPPVSYQRGRAWRKLLETAAKGPDRHFWLTHYMLGCIYIVENEFDRAEEALERSCALLPNAWNTYACAELYRILGDARRAASTALAAAAMAPEDASLCKMTARMLANAQMYEVLRDFTNALPEQMQKLPRIRLYRAFAAEKLDDLELAEQILYADGGLEVPDIQEGEVSITKLWYAIAEKKAKRDGKEFDEKKVRPPKIFDFRMDAPE